MTLDYRKKGQVMIDMRDYVNTMTNNFFLGISQRKQNEGTMGCQPIQD